MKTKEVSVEKYQKSWPKEFERISKEIQMVLQGFKIKIEHIGSTSVPELSAKPIIDLTIVIEDYCSFDGVVRGLSELGYHHEGNLGITDREAFGYSGKEHLMKHHLYVCPKYSEKLKRNLKFRDHLRNSIEDRQKYSLVKEEGAHLYPKDIDAYIHHKSSVILEIYKKIGLITI